jgi:hypothetical protein
MDKLIKKLESQLAEYTKLVNEAEAKGLENLDLGDTETYGVYLGKKELLEELIPTLQKLA